MARNWTYGLLLRAMRPRQWTKNILLFAGLFFSGLLLDPGMIGRAIVGFIVFCALSGATYLLNDVIDYDRDRLHPRKRLRPIASGELPVATARRAAFLIGVAALLVSLWVSPFFALCALAYLFMMAAYCFSLKDVFLIDTLIIAMGFTIRAIAGVIILRTPQTEVPLTSWFLICIIFLSLFLAFAKRRSERIGLEADAIRFRPVLHYYSVELSDTLIGICATGAILAYTLYATTVPNSWQMLTTLPFVLFGIFRYLHLIYNTEDGDAPENLLFTDGPLLGCILLWGVSLLFVYFPQH